MNQLENDIKQLNTQIKQGNTALIMQDKIKHIDQNYNTATTNISTMAQAFQSTTLKQPQSLGGNSLLSKVMQQKFQPMP